MKVVFAFSLLLFAYSYAAGQSLPTKKEQWDFLKWYIKAVNPRALSDTSFSIKQLGFKMEDLDNIQPEELKIKKDDRAYLTRQINLKSLMDTAIIKHTDWKKGSEQVPVTHLSTPIFMQSKNVVFIYHSYHCGPECGQGGVEVFIKIKGVWKKINVTVPVWIS